MTFTYEYEDGIRLGSIKEKAETSLRLIKMGVDHEIIMKAIDIDDKDYAELIKEYHIFKELSSDEEKWHKYYEQKNLEFTARQKALYDYNTMMEESYQHGREIASKRAAEKLRESGYSEQEIAELLS